MPQLQPEIIGKKTDDTLPSRAEMKRRMDRLQDLGRRLVELTPGKLQRLDLPEKLLGAVREAGRLTSMGAARRQLQYIGRIMEEFDTVSIARALRDIDFTAAPKPEPEKVEAVLIAEELLTGGDDALFARFGAEADPVQMQRLRQALRLARKNIAAGKNAAQEVELLAAKFTVPVVSH